MDKSGGSNINTATAVTPPSLNVLVSNMAWVKKSELSEQQISALKQALTIQIRKVGNYPGEAPGPLFLYKEVGDLFGMPREYYMQRRKEHHLINYKMSENKVITDLSLGSNPRPEQQEALDKIVSWHDQGNTGCMLRASPGWGKSYWGCLLLTKLPYKTIIIVHKDFLMKQWEERIGEFLPNAKVGKVQGDIFDIDGKDIVLAMVQSLSQRDYPSELYTEFGCMILDECHRVGARSFSIVPGKFNPRFKVGLSATIRRKDGADDVFYYHLGPIVFSAKEQRMAPKIRRVYTDFNIHASKNLNPGLITKPLLLRFMCANTSRNKQIVEQIILSVKAGRRPLVLSERIEHLKDMMELTDQMWTDPSPKPTMGLYIGGMKDEEYERSKTCTIMFATSQLVSEGFDHTILDTLFLTTPGSDVEQQVGRILRPHPDKKEPVVVDIRDDNVQYCHRCAESREKLYSKICLDNKQPKSA